MIKYRNGKVINTNDPNFILAYGRLRDIITKPLSLVYPNFTVRFMRVPNASNCAISTVLILEGHLIGYASRIECSRN